MVEVGPEKYTKILAIRIVEVERRTSRTLRTSRADVSPLPFLTLRSRLAKLALNNGITGALEAPSSYLMKSPPKQIRDDESRELIERFIAQNALKPTKAAAKA